MLVKSKITAYLLHIILVDQQEWLCSWITPPTCEVAI